MDLRTKGIGFQSLNEAAIDTTSDPKVVLAKKLHADKSLEIDDICKTLRMLRSTFYRYVRL